MDKYNSIASPSQGEYKEKGSKFHAFAYPISSAEESKPIIEKLRKTYYDARHVCFAYRLGIEKDIFRIYDDGEPSGSAGKPILGQIASHNLSDILIVVVRYFGGTKLGVSGLAQAYKQAAADAIANGTVVEKVVTKQIVLQFGYEQLNEVMRLIKDESLEIIAQQLDIKSLITLKVALGKHLGTVEKIEKLRNIEIVETDD